LTRYWLATGDNELRVIPRTISRFDPMKLASLAAPFDDPGFIFELRDPTDLWDVGPLRTTCSLSSGSSETTTITPAISDSKKKFMPGGKPGEAAEKRRLAPA
jgi:hypothetical protein